jgi:hypothetical protein
MEALPSDENLHRTGKICTKVGVAATTTAVIVATAGAAAPALTGKGLLVAGADGLGKLAASETILGAASTGAAGGGAAVYRALDAGKQTVYVGVTNDFARRGAEHLRTTGIRIESIPGLDNLTRIQARGVEQALINLHGLAKNGGTLLNKINSIATHNPVYQSAVQFGKEMLKSVNYPGAGGG